MSDSTQTYKELAALIAAKVNGEQLEKYAKAALLDAVNDYNVKKR